SDPLGLLCGVILLCGCLVGERKGPHAWLATAALGGVMLGVRLVNVTMLAPLAWKGWSARGERWRRVPVPLALLAALAVGVVPWRRWPCTAWAQALRARGGRGSWPEWAGWQCWPWPRPMRSGLPRWRDGSRCGPRPTSSTYSWPMM